MLGRHADDAKRPARRLHRCTAGIMAKMAALLATALAAAWAGVLEDGYYHSPVEIPSHKRLLCDAAHSARIAPEHLCTPDACVFDPANFKYSKMLKAPASADDTGFFIYWDFNADLDEIAIGVDAHNAPGYVGRGISANGGMMQDMYSNIVANMN